MTRPNGVRRAITAFFRLCLRIFFRRIEIAGAERVPLDRAVVFAVNHPNGLVDPLFLLCFASRPVSFLAKAPLFHTPVIGWFVRALDAIPVYRKQDETAGSNEETFAKARALLRAGGGIAIFPEGTTHDDPALRALKTGAARIALGAQIEGLVVVPVGIYYTARHAFRSAALVLFGEPLPVPLCASGNDGEPPAEEVARLTGAIDEALDAVTLQADSRSALDLVARAEDIFTADEEQPLAQELDLRRRFVEGYRYLQAHDPVRLERLQSAVQQFESELRRTRFEIDELKPRIYPSRLLRVLVLLPAAVAGAIVNYPTYRLVGVLARRFSNGEVVLVSTVKFLAALAFYPLTYIALASIAGWRFGLVTGLLTLLALPFVSYAALRVFE
ncbi:MAG TPA: lysophospholipid acyltransferase family protein, partial [Thermoanaerobaculia bacterium]|nr:lysophospholipid acyltransferase family protein [Thermoanaerobaculia bacterium]